MLEKTTLNHFDKISSTWEQKGWVHSKKLNSHIQKFIRQSEKKTGLHTKKYRSSIYFGIGTGALFNHFPRYSIAGVDEARDMLGRCPEGIIQILSKVEELPFLMDNQFNLAFSRNLLKHCNEPFLAIESMYNKTRPGGVAIAAESVVLHKRDREIPTKLVRMTDPAHPAFLTSEEVIALYYKAGFRHVESVLVPYRSAWFQKWLTAEQAGDAIEREVLNMYKKAPKSFIKQHNVIIENNEITSTVPWLLLRAYK
jgi:ubiquinone/menaquinone biosynthesis C-methylase UbiE